MTTRSTHRLLPVVLLILTLLTALVIPALAQESVPPPAPLTSAPLTQTTRGACTPLSKDEQAAFAKLAQINKAGQLAGADYDLFLKLSEQADCATQSAAPEGAEAVSSYTFAQSSGTYTAISGGSTLGTAANDDTLFPSIAIGFSFNYDGTAYTTVGVCSNGYIVMGLNTGSSCGTPYTPISSATYNNLISALGMDLQGNTTSGELRYQTQGSTPNRTFTVQWKSYRKYNVTGDDFNFQVTFYETTNVVEIKYGAFNVNATSSTPQVGIKGASTSDYSNRTTTTNWSASTAGDSNSATMTLSTTVKPASGQTYTWTPPSGPPVCAISPAPANAATNVSISTTLAWSAGAGSTPTSYDVYFGTSGTPPFVANVAASPYNPGALAYSTTYYWQIIPKNGSGSASGCSVWSFTTQADPTITTFPYSQNFDGVTAPALPSGWSSSNDNSDAYTWQTSTSYPRSSPNSMYIRYNTSLAMNDWFFSPPLQLTGGTHYQVTFWYRTYSGGVEKMEVKWGTSASAAGMTGGQIFNDSNITSATYIQGTSSAFTPSSNGIYYVGWHGYSAANQWYLMVDDVTIEATNTPPACATSFSPADAATGVAATANLTWASGGGSPTGYKLFFGTNNPPTNIANGADLGNVTTYDPPGNMAYSTLHYWKIVPYNANGDATGCSVLSFTIEADPTVTTFPYSQGFDGGSYPGWTLENTNGDANVWGIGTTYKRGASGGAAIVYYNSSMAMNDWLFTPPLQLTGGAAYGVRFFYRSSGATYPEKMEVKWGSAASSGGMSNGPIFDDPAITNTAMKEALATFTPGSSGVYYVGFHGYSAADMFYLVVDDVTVYNTADSTWQWQGGASTDWGANANWEGSIVPGLLDTVEIPVVADAPLANPPIIGSYSETSYGPVANLTVDAGATLELASANSLTVGGAVTNNGTLKQTRTVAASGTTSFLNIPTARYYGVDISAGATALGSTTVTIGGNQVCSLALGYPVKRCFNVTPTTQAAADIKFYYNQTEMQAGQTYDTLNVWNYHSGAWNTVTRGGDSGSCAVNAINCYVQGTGIANYSPFVLKVTAPTAITLADFGATQTGDAVVLTWETATELNNRGFNLYRGVSPSAPDRQLNETLIPSQSQGNPGGFVYTWEDRADLVSGTTYFYWVEDVDIYGTATRHGPVSVDYNAPTALRLLDAGAAAAPPGAWPVVGAGLLALAAAVIAWRKRRLS